MISRGGEYEKEEDGVLFANLGGALNRAVLLGGGRL